MMHDAAANWYSKRPLLTLNCANNSEMAHVCAASGIFLANYRFGYKLQKLKFILKWVLTLNIGCVEYAPRLRERRRSSGTDL